MLMLCLLRFQAQRRDEWGFRDIEQFPARHCLVDSAQVPTLPSLSGTKVKKAGLVVFYTGDHLTFSATPLKIFLTLVFDRRMLLWPQLIGSEG